MKKILLILLCFPMIGFGQGWEQTYGGIDHEYGRSVQQTTDGGYIITGHTASFGNGQADFYLIKIDGNGVEQWNQTFGGTEWDEGHSVQQTTDGGYIITGHTASFGNGSFDVYLIKTNGNGVEQWNQTFGGPSVEYGFSVQQTTDGGYIICGAKSLHDVYLIKTNGNGVEQWSQVFVSPSSSGGGGGGYSVQQTTDGGYIICGQRKINNINISSDVYLIKTDGNGDSLWAKTFGGTITDWGESVQQTTDGGYIICGTTQSFANGMSDFYLIKTDGNGVEQWNKTIGGIDDERGKFVQQTSDGGYIITGEKSLLMANGYHDFSDVYLVKTDGNGDEQWNQTFGGMGYDLGKSVQQTTDGGYIICGVKNFSSSSSVYLIKTDDNGNATSTFNIPIPNANRKLQKVTDILGRETKGKTNKPLFYIFDDGTVEKRIIIE